MKNLNRKIKKLQYALCQYGRIFKINTYQFYSVDQKRMITGYSVREKQPYVRKDGEVSMRDVELFNSCSQIELLKWFSEEYEKVKKNA